MVFSSLTFLFYFLTITALIYYLVPRSWRNGVLFLCSLIFYAWGEPIYFVLMIFSTLVDFYHGQKIEQCRNAGKMKSAKVYLISSVIINLTLLGFFKYTDFIIGNINTLTGLAIPLLKLPLPIGISFYTFQTMSYSIDVYRGNTRAQKNIVTFGCYVTLFPQLIAGPIVRYVDVANELDHRRESCLQLAKGIRRFLIGLAKKVLLANSVGAIWTQLQSLPQQELSVLGAWLGAFCFTFQIYFDFSGYSDMAIGLGQMFGFQFLENFNYPYISKTITEFWRRWHISLSTWFREYVYIPLGGNRNGKTKQLRNLLIVWALTGIWHGASWNFLAWGLYYFFWLMLEKLFLLRWLEKIPSFFRHIYTIVIVVFGWVIFSFESFTAGFGHITTMFGGGAHLLWDDRAVYLLASNAILLLISIIAATPLPSMLGNGICRITRKKPVLSFVLENGYLLVIFLMSVAYLVNSSYNPFLYFRF